MTPLHHISAVAPVWCSLGWRHEGRLLGQPRWLVGDERLCARQVQKGVFWAWSRSLLQRYFTWAWRCAASSEGCLLGLAALRGL